MFGYLVMVGRQNVIFALPLGSPLPIIVTPMPSSLETLITWYKLQIFIWLYPKIRLFRLSTEKSYFFFNNDNYIFEIYTTWINVFILFTKNYLNFLILFLVIIIIISYRLPLCCYVSKKEYRKMAASRLGT